MKNCTLFGSIGVKHVLLILVTGAVIYSFRISLYPYFPPERHLTALSRFRAENCTFPITPTFPKYFQKWNPKKGYKGCEHEKNLLHIFDDGNLTLLPLDDVNNTCCIQDIVRGRKDSEHKISECQPLNSPADISTRESFIVQCGNYTNFEAWCPDRPAVDRKIQFWTENFPDVDDRPYNVLFFGFDTVSRAHAYRSLPQSLKLMREDLNFVDFKAYHSIAGSTLTNFMGFLMGLPRQVVGETCSKTWKAPYDSCPFIWKNYNESNYVTSYLEDGNQSFDWGGQSGFINAPTDYYIHHFFKALENIRSKEKKKYKRDKTRKDCVSQEPIPDFLLRYTKRVLRKFEDIPFFQFLWFADPFHDDLNYLSNFDDVLLEFLEFLQNSPRILRKTIIIMVSDHGDRFKFYRSGSTESFIERGAPPLFIRLPDQLTEKHPEMLNVLKRNTEFLTTPFDIHHTLLHWLRMCPNEKTDSKSVFNATEISNAEKFVYDDFQFADTEKFVPVLPDRSSLLVPVPTNRTCATTNIPALNCLCNVPYAASSTKKMVTKEYVDFSIEAILAELNAKVKRNKNGHLCKKWTCNSKEKKKNSGRIVGIGEDYVDVLVSFKTNEGGVEFESRVNVFLAEGASGKESPVRTEVTGLGRSNAWGKHNKCVVEGDKEMREFCFCR